MFCDGWVKCGVFSNDPAVQVIILALLQSVIGQESLKYFPEISFKYPQQRLDLLNMALFLLMTHSLNLNFPFFSRQWHLIVF